MTTEGYDGHVLREEALLGCEGACSLRSVRENYARQLWELV